MWPKLWFNGFSGFLDLLMALSATALSSKERIFQDFPSNSLSLAYDPCELELGSNLAFHRQTNRCYELNTRGPCAENMIFYSKRYPSKHYGDCSCDRKIPCVYNSSTKKCHVLFHKAYCPDGYWLRLNEFGNLECESNPCPNGIIGGLESNRDNYVLVNGVCARLGEQCGISEVIAFRDGNFEPECVGKTKQTHESGLIHSESISCQNGTQWSVTLRICEVSATDAPKDDFRAVALNLTNEYRAMHQASPLVEDAELNKIAQAYAERLAMTNLFEHSMRKDYGENLYYYKGTGKAKSALVLEAIKAWYAESKDYDYNLPLFDTHTAHFTQLVWKASERQGLGLATNPTTNYSVVVINYTPPGNWEGEFFENVRRSFNPDEALSVELDDDSLFTIF